MKRRLNYNILGLKKLAMEEDNLNSTEGKTNPEADGGEGAGATPPAPTEPAVTDPAVADPAAATNGEGGDNQVVVTLPEGTKVEEVEVVISEEDLAVIDTDTAQTVEILNSADKQVDEAEGVFNEAPVIENTVAVLESYADLMRLSASRGGMSVETAAAIEIGINYAFESIDYDGSTPLPAMEAFTVAGSPRIGGTTLAMENLGQRTKEIVDNVIQAIRAAFQWVVNYGKSLVDARFRMESNAKKLIEAAGKIGENQPAATVGNANLVTRLLKGKAVSQHLVADLVALNGFARSTVDGRSTQALGTLTSVMQKLSAQTGETGSSADAAVSAVEAIIGKGLKPAAMTAEQLGLEAAPEGTKLYTSDVFLGNVVFWAYMPQDGQHFDKLRIGSTVVGEAEANKAGTLPALAAGDIVKVAQTVLDYTKSVDEYRKAEAAVKKFAETLAKDLTTYSSKSRDGDGVSATVSNLLSVYRGSRALVRGLHQPAFAAAARVNSSALEYARLSLGAYTKGKGAAAPATQALPAA